MPDDVKDRYNSAKSKREQVEILKELGYDGWTADFENGEGYGEVSAFYPTQIKSATSNNGEYSGKDDDINYRAVFHGSAHSFDKFNHTFMGSGEGVQAFGWGTYVTEVEDIGRGYAIALTNNADGNKRNLYTVEIPENNGSNYLMWDDVVGEDIVKKVSEVAMSMGYDTDFMMDRYEGIADLYGLDGGGLYKIVESSVTDLDGNSITPQLASSILSKSGFVGISYPAQATSGGRTDKARNYVIFNESDLEITNHELFRYAKTPIDFDMVQREAVRQKGIVAPNLNEASVKVVEVEKHDFKGSGKQAIEQAKIWAYNNLIGDYIAYTNKPFKYTIDINAIRKYLSGITTSLSDNLGVHLSVLKSLPVVINNSIEGEVHPDYLKINGNRSSENPVSKDMLIHRLYGAVNIDGTTYRIKTTIKENQNSNNKVYSYEVTKVELLKSGSSLKGTSSSNALSNSTSISATKLLKDVEKSYDKGKKLLDESETRVDLLSESQAIINTVTQTAESLSTPVVVINNTDDITDKNPLVQRRKRRSKGWYDNSTDTVYVVIPNHTSTADAKATVLHEVVGHRGLKSLMGESEYNDFMTKVLDSASEEVRDEYLSRYGNPITAAEEYVATMAEQDVDPTAWERVKRLVKSAFRALGIDLDISDYEIRVMLWRGKNALNKNTKTSVILDRITNDRKVVKTQKQLKEVIVNSF